MDNTRKRQINIADQGRYTPISSLKPSENGLQGSKAFSMAFGAKNFEKYEIIVDNEHLQQEMRTIEWRSRTDLPLVKVLFYKILQKKLVDECSVVQVAIENFTHTLYTLQRVGFYQILYLLKESLVGFSHLYDRFGPFEVSQKMVLINKSCKCRVWLNENVTVNFPGRKANIAEKQFLARIIQMFQEKCVRSLMVTDLFQKMSTFQKITQAIQYLEGYLKTSRITLPSRLMISFDAGMQNLNDCKLPKTPTKAQDRDGWFNAMKTQSFGGSQLKKIPKFILNLREERKLDTSIDMKSDISKGKQPIKRNISQIKLLNKSHSRQDLHKEPHFAFSKSNNNSPLSNISRKSNNQKTSSNLPRTTVRNIVRHFSQEQQYVNPFQTFSIHKKRQGPTSTIQRLEPPNRQYQPFRAFPQSSTYLPITSFMDSPHFQASSAKDLSSVNCSQQTATTINESSINQTESRSSLDPQQQPLQDEGCSIFEKNGWMRRVNNLTEEEFSKEMFQSQHEGIEVFSESYALAGEDLVFLGAMGKEVKSSLLEECE